MKKYCTLCAFLILGTTIQATHIMGGNLRYRYLGKSGIMLRYELRVELYRDCGSSTNPFSNTITVGIYHDKDSRSSYGTISLNKVSDTATLGMYPCVCKTFGIGICSATGVYTSEIMLPPISGYHLYYQQCCRNTQMNIDSAQGIALYAYLANASDTNSSAAYVPSVYGLCTGDTLSIQQPITDPDADSVVYGFIKPLGSGILGATSGVQPGWFTLNIPSITYRTGYSLSNPTGSNGFASLSSGGMLELKAAATGRYVLAFETKEYRNGVVTGGYISQMQVICYPCSIPAKMDTCRGATYVSNHTSVPSAIVADEYYQVKAGDTLRFNVRYFEPTTEKVELYMATHPFRLDSAVSFVQLSQTDTSLAEVVWATNPNDWIFDSILFLFAAEKCGCCQLNIAGHTVHVSIYSPMSVHSTYSGGDEVTAWFSGNLLTTELKAAHPAMLQLFDLNGRLVLQQTILPGTSATDAANLPPGMYLLQTGDTCRKLCKVN